MRDQMILKPRVLFDMMTINGYCVVMAMNSVVEKVVVTT